MADPVAAGPEPAVRFGLLGPLQVVDSAGTARAVPAAKQRIALAALLLGSGSAVSAAGLAEALWDSCPPPNASAVMRTYVSRLRRALGPVGARLVGHPSGWAVDFHGPEEFDLAEVDSLWGTAQEAAEAGQWGQVSSMLTKALSLWRGEPLVDVPSAALSRREAGRLAELWLQLTEARIDADLHLDRHGELVAELRRLAAEHPLREHIRVQLMLACYRCGHQGAALEAYRDARGTLAEELGVEPGPELREMHQKILAADPGLATAGQARLTIGQADNAFPRQPVPRQLPAAGRHFTGRAAELKRLTELVEEARATDTAATIVIGGMPGVGKTTLAVHFAHQVARHFPDGQLYVNLRGFDPTGQPMPPDEAIRGFLDFLQIPAERVPANLDAQAGLYRSMLSGRRMLVLLDNARDADQVRPLLPGRPGCLVLVTSRRQLTGLVTAQDAYPLNLGVLTQVEAEELLACRLGVARITTERAVIRELAGLCAALPLALSIVAAQAAEHPDWPLAAAAARLRDAHRRLDMLDPGDAATALRGVFSWSYRQLSEPAAGLFRLLGIHPGPDSSLPAAASMAGLTVRQTQAALDELIGAGLVWEQQSGRFTLHDLLRVYAAEQSEICDTAAQRQAATGRVLDHYLHTGHAAAALYPTSFVLDVPVATTPRPGVIPEELEDHSQALAWFRTEDKVMIAATAQAVGEFDTYAMQIPLVLRPFLHRSGRWQDCITTGRTALAAARRLGDTAGQAHAHCHLGSAYAMTGGYTEANVHLTAALALYQRIGHPRGQGIVHTGLETLFHLQQRDADALDQAEMAVEQFRIAGYRDGEATGLNNVGWCHVVQGNVQQALPFLRQAADLQSNSGNTISLAYTLDSLGYAHHIVGEHRQAITYYQRAESLSRKFANRCLLAQVLIHCGEAHQAAADPRGARQAWQQALVILTDLNFRDADHIRNKLASLGP
jgi:DNA-binding SARP family transcriptional activator/tetratricopeptide (TPR) repeat protein